MKGPITYQCARKQLSSTSIGRLLQSTNIDTEEHGDSLQEMRVHALKGYTIGAGALQNSRTLNKRLANMYTN